MSPLLGIFITNSISILLIAFFLLFYPNHLQEEGWFWKVFWVFLILALLLYLLFLILLAISLKNT